MKMTIAIMPELRFRLAYAEKLDIDVPEDAVPEGWQLVPVDPTPEMISRGRPENTQHGLLLAEATYRAMLAAAPKPEGGEG